MQESKCRRWICQMNSRKHETCVSVAPKHGNITKLFTSHDTSFTHLIMMSILCPNQSIDIVRSNDLTAILCNRLHQLVSFSHQIRHDKLYSYTNITQSIIINIAMFFIPGWIFFRYLKYISHHLGIAALSNTQSVITIPNSHHHMIDHQVFYRMHCWFGFRHSAFIERIKHKWCDFTLFIRGFHRTARDWRDIVLHINDAIIGECNAMRNVASNTRNTRQTRREM